MIKKVDYIKRGIIIMRFRLLNSEIGNDPIKYQNGIRMGFTSIK